MWKVRKPYDLLIVMLALKELRIRSRGLSPARKLRH